MPPPSKLQHRPYKGLVYNDNVNEALVYAINIRPNVRFVESCSSVILKGTSPNSEERILCGHKYQGQSNPDSQACLESLGSFVSAMDDIKLVSDGLLGLGSAGVALL
ncbi:hypothetical protein OS493_021212 [Desmophyllum pertusum]|uniref:Uncharacterized protein n=1 Tax=Desmophyllum pertusum TaxID=174260 RepID=A0A9X0D2V8_9CNID|nr:hypothetical protein OS493_021212 [Desmophyllum pertusum]